MELSVDLILSLLLGATVLGFVIWRKRNTRLNYWWGLLAVFGTALILIPIAEKLDKVYFPVSPTSQREYESLINQKCIDVASESKNANNKDFVSACLYAAVMNDAISTDFDTKLYAQQTLSAVYDKKAGNFSDSQLISELSEDLRFLLGNYDMELGLKVGAFGQEVSRRKITNAEIERLRTEMLAKYGVCWGIPEGECRE